MKFRFFGAVLSIVLGMVAAAPVQAAEQRVMDRVFLIKDRPGSSTRFEMIVNAGSNDEAQGEVHGVAHYLEHLVLVGRNPEHKDLAIRFFADGSANGWTNERATVFLHNFPERPDGAKAEIEKLFGFYAARLSGFNITDADAARERNVVLQEHDFRVQSSPSSLFFRDLSRKLIPGHPAGQWTIGTRDSIKAMTIEEARGFHNAWYGPNNVWFVVRGDITPEALKEIATKALADVPPKLLPLRNSDRLPEISIERFDERRGDPLVTRPLVTVSKLVRIDEPDIQASRAARVLLGNFLGSQFSGSPYDVLVEEKKLAAERVSMSIRRVAPRTFSVSASANPAPDVTPEVLREALLAYINDMAATLPPDATFDRLKKRIAESRIRANKDTKAVHERLVGWLAEGNDYKDMASWPKKIAGTTRADIEVLAKAFAAPGRVVTGILEPGEKK